jgi:uncharacterized membrane protein YgdD (TMEM256/DUF423 family)
MTWTLWIIAGSLLAAVAIVLDTLGIWLLNTRYSEPPLKTFEKTVRMQMFHALGLLAVGFTALRIDTPALTASGIAFLAGTLLYCGVGYSACFVGKEPPPPLTVAGSLAFAGGWVALALAMVHP